MIGFFRIRTTIPDCKYVPSFPFKTNNKLIFQLDRFITYCTLAELQACNNQKYYKILESYQYLDGNPVGFIPGDFVQIVKNEENSETIYRIKKIKKSKEGIILYILKPESNGKEILYYEGKYSYLQQVMQVRTTKKTMNYKKW